MEELKAPSDEFNLILSDNESSKNHINRHSRQLLVNEEIQNEGMGEEAVTMMGTPEDR